MVVPCRPQTLTMGMAYDPPVPGVKPPLEQFGPWRPFHDTPEDVFGALTHYYDVPCEHVQEPSGNEPCRAVLCSCGSLEPKERSPNHLHGAQTMPWAWTSQPPALDHARLHPASASALTAPAHSPACCLRFTAMWPGWPSAPSQATLKLDADLRALPSARALHPHPTPPPRPPVLPGLGPTQGCP